MVLFLCYNALLCLFSAPTLFLLFRLVPSLRGVLIPKKMLKPVVIVGDSICGSRNEKSAFPVSDDVFLRGFNTFAGPNPNDHALSFEGAGEIVAAVNGVVEITDRVVSVKGKLPRYLPEIGDVVVGRIAEVAGSRWVVDVNSTQMAVMLLSNVTEPGGILRRRGRGDELSMRQLFDQGDLIAAEVQRISADGVISLHTRAGEKYGKLSSLGQLVTVNPSLVKRSKHQYLTLSEPKCELVIGMNGCIWVSWKPDEAVDADTGMAAASDSEARQGACRAANCIRVLGLAGFQIHPQTIELAVEASVSAALSPFDTLLEKNRELLVSKVREGVGVKRQRA